MRHQLLLTFMGKIINHFWQKQHYIIIRGQASKVVLLQALIVLILLLFHHRLWKPIV